MRVKNSYVSFAVICLNSVLLFIAINLLLGVFYRWRDRAPETGEVAEQLTAETGLSQAARYPGWSDQDVVQLARESRNRPYTSEPFTGFREQTFAGKFVNVTDAGFRVSKDQGPWPLDRRQFNVFVFGGSTTFGLGVADHETVPSVLQKLLSRSSQRKVAVYNFGRSDYFSTLERILFQELLVSGGVAPDLAVFVDGLNEFRGLPREAVPSFENDRSWSQDLLNLYEALPIRRVDQMLRRRFRSAPEAAAAQGPHHEDDRVMAVLARYAANKRATAAIANAFGVPVLFVWHPVPTYGYDLSLHPVFKQGLKGLSITSRGYERAAQHVRAGEWGQIAWCADLQVGAKEPLYVDRWHFTSRFSEDVASCILQNLKTHALWK